MQTWVRPGTDSMYKVLGSAGQREEGLEGVGQWADLEEGAGFQLGVKDGSLNFKRTGREDSASTVPSVKGRRTRPARVPDSGVRSG